MSVPSMRRTASVVQQLVMTVSPHGGQGVARRNAWASMAEGSARARARRDADAAMEQALQRVSRTAAAGH